MCWAGGLRSCMISRVLAPVDSSEMAERAVRYAPEAHPDTEITVLRVVGEPFPMMGKAMSLALEDDIEQAAQEHASAALQRARDIAGQFNTEITTDVPWGHPAKAIIKRAEDFITVVIGSHGGTLNGFFWE